MPILIKPLLEPLSFQDAEDITLLMSESPTLWSSTVAEAPINAQSLIQAIHQPPKRMLYGACFNGRIVGIALLQQQLTQATSLKQDCPIKANPKENDYLVEEVFHQKEVEILVLCVRTSTRKRSVASQTLVRLQQVAEEEHWRLLLSKHKLKEVSFMLPTIKALGFTETRNHWVWSCMTRN